MADRFEKCSDETVERFKDFVKIRAAIENRFKVSATAGELASATVIEYSYSVSADDGKHEPDDAGMSVYAGVTPEDEVSVLELFVDSNDEIQYGGEAIGSPDDTFVNEILDRTTKLEAAGRITPPVPSP